VESDICLTATAQQLHCSYNKSYIAYFYCACAKRPYFHFRSKIWCHHRVPRSRFPVSHGNFGDSAINNGYIAHFYCARAKQPYFRFWFEDVFSWFFFIKKAKSPPYFYFWFIWPTDLGSVPRVETPMLNIPPSLKLIRLSIAELQRYWRGYVTRPCDLDLWPFDLGQWSDIAGHVVNPSTKFEDPTPIRS